MLSRTSTSRARIPASTTTMASNRPPLPAIPPSALPQYIAPSRASRALQLSSFALGTGASQPPASSAQQLTSLNHPGVAFYAVLLYDFGPGEHCFMPVRSPHRALSNRVAHSFSTQVRRWFDNASSGFFTLSDKDRKVIAAQAPLTTTPAHFFNGEVGGAEKKV